MRALATSACPHPQITICYFFIDDITECDIDIGIRVSERFITRGSHSISLKPAADGSQWWLIVFTNENTQLSAAASKIQFVAQ